MNYFIYVLSVLMFIGCSNPSNKKPNIIYSGHTIPIEGGQILMNVDSISSINNLIQQLQVHNDFLMTGKAYWIGYNDCMFSIALRGDSAIIPLLDFIDTTNHYLAKLAAINTLHLIGINCKIAGRTTEKFDNLKARDALFKTLNNNDSIQRYIMLLLGRDPRESDVPKLFNVLKSSTNDCWPITNKLLFYNLQNIPVRQMIPKKIQSLQIPVDKPQSWWDDRTSQEVFQKLAIKYKHYVKIEETLFKYNFDHPVAWPKNDNEFVNLNKIASSDLEFGYLDIGNNYSYFIKQNKINFCSAATSKKLWIKWWDSQNQTYKDSLMKSDKRIFE